MDILALLFPKEKKFYRMVEKQVTLIGSAVSDFYKLIQSYEKTSPQIRKKLTATISLREKQDDRLYSEMVNALKSTFITPIDREDLLKLVSMLDLIMNNLEMIVFKMDAFKIKKLDEKIKEQTRLLHESFRLIEKLIFSIQNASYVENYCLKIREIEQTADITYIEGLKHLFSDSMSPILIIKLKDLYSSLEKIIDEVQEAALIIENVTVKYS